jgi:hypothetical protein
VALIAPIEVDNNSAVKKLAGPSAVSAAASKKKLNTDNTAPRRCTEGTLLASVAAATHDKQITGAVAMAHALKFPRASSAPERVELPLMNETKYPPEVDKCHIINKTCNGG